MMGYIASGGAMFTAKLIFRLFGASVDCYNLLLAGRLANLFFYSLVIYAAIRICPCFKRLITLIALMPTSLFLAASLSYDALLISTCLLLFAIVVKFRTDNKTVTFQWFLVMCLISLVLFNVKMVYAPLLISLAFISPQQFGGLKKYLISGVVIVGTGLMALVINQVFLSAALEGFQNPYSQVESEQTAFLLSNLLAFFGMIVNTLRMFSSSFLSQFIGTISTYTLQMPIILLILYGVVLVVTAVLESRYIKVIGVKQKIVLAATLLLVLYASFAGIYVTWTAIQQGAGGNWVDGFQGRYFIPSAIFIVLLITRKAKKVFNESIIDNVVFYLVTVFPVLVCILIVLKFWML